MARSDHAELARVLPRLRHDFETSRRLVARAVDRATRLADEAVATRRLLESRTQGSRGNLAPNAEIWNAAARELVRASRERDRELGVVAHELRQSLSAALAADRLLAVTSKAETVDRARAVLSRQLEHLSALVESLLDYSRLSLYGSVIQRRPVDLREIVTGAIETAGAVAAERAQHLTFREEGRLAPVEGDPLRLRQAVSNLLQNAVRYTPEGGRIDVVLADGGPHALVSVHDSGEGIPAERLEAIFDPFVRLSGVGPGLGIGLALVRRIVELHGGTVTAASEGAGRGSVFTISLPRTAEDARARA